MAEKKRVLIIGGGFGGLFTALELSGSAEVTLVSDDDHFLFTPMLYELFSGEVESWQVAPYFKELLGDDIQFIKGCVSSIDFNKREAIIPGQNDPLTYDALVIAVGGISNYWGIEGAHEYAIPFRKAEHAAALRQRMVEALDAVPPNAAPQVVRRAITFMVTGAGASGVELSTKMADLLRDAFKRRALKGEPRVMIVEMGDRVVPGMGHEIREFVEKALNESRVEVHTSTVVKRVTPGTVILEHDGVLEEVPVAGVVWNAGVRVNPLIDTLDLEKDKRGLVLVEPTLQTKHYPEVFVLGDAAFYPDASPRLAGTAQLALQQGDLAADNIKALFRGRKLKTKHFQELGEAVSLGTSKAAVLVGEKAFGGPLARDARFAMYTARLPTWHHRLKVGASWFFGGTAPRPLQPLGL
jgi:NADH:ubiquinone reductase (non-electrogenic)